MRHKLVSPACCSLDGYACESGKSRLLTCINFRYDRGLEALLFALLSWLLANGVNVKISIIHVYEQSRELELRARERILEPIRAQNTVRLHFTVAKRLR